MPLEGIKVVELGSLIAGPYASSLLGQFGADIIKIEPPKYGDPLRKWRKLYNDTSLWWYSQSRNKRSITLDLKSPEAQEVVKKLVVDADIVIENFRPGTLEKWNLGWEILSSINPDLIMVRISGYGQTGPASQRPGFAAVAECMGGLRFVTGNPNQAPVRTGVSLGDTLASLYGTIGALMAMHHLKVNGGKGQYIDVALYESVFAVMESLVPEYSMYDYVRERSGAALPGIAPSNTYICNDGDYVAIAANGDAIFKRLMIAIGRRDLAEDARLSSNDGRVTYVDMLDAAISEWTEQYDIDKVLSVLAESDVPCGRIYSVADIVKDEQYKARNMIERFQLDDGTFIDLPGIVPKLSETPGQTRWLGPSLGQHTEEILESIGITKEQYEKMRAAGIV